MKYRIEFSTDGGVSWKPVVKDWSIPRRGEEPGDFWSQSFCYGSVDLEDADVEWVRVRFSNDGGKKVLRAEVHAVYRTTEADPARVTFAWTDAGGERRAEHVFSKRNGGPWKLATGTEVRTRWVEFEPAPAR